MTTEFQTDVFHLKTHGSLTTHKYNTGQLLTFPIKTIFYFKLVVKRSNCASTYG
jgi:hypothetical protein